MTKRKGSAVDGGQNANGHTNEQRTPDEVKQKRARSGSGPARSAEAEKTSKGLRHFSNLVCEKVKQKGRTTYNEVASELVQELTSNRAILGDVNYDEKSIRRRIYDALNVLMALDIITKEKKDIRWMGLPNNSKHDLDCLQEACQSTNERIQRKKEQLQELLVQSLTLKNLTDRNRDSKHAKDSRITLPFIIVHSSRDAVIECEMAEDRSEILFNFTVPFEIHDDNEMLQRMNMHKVDASVLPNYISPMLIPYLPSSLLANLDAKPGMPSQGKNMPYLPASPDRHGVPQPTLLSPMHSPIKWSGAHANGHVNGHPNVSGQPSGEPMFATPNRAEVVVSNDPPASSAPAASMPPTMPVNPSVGLGVGTPILAHTPLLSTPTIGQNLDHFLGVSMSSLDHELLTAQLEHELEMGTGSVGVGSAMDGNVARQANNNGA